MKRTFLTNVCCKALCMLLISVCSILPLIADEGDFGPNLLDTMPDSEWKALNIFFSNFSETGFEDYNSLIRDDRALIGFAARHNVQNNTSLFNDDKTTGESYLPEQNIKETIKKYFGIEKFTAQNGSSYDVVVYEKGRYYWYDIFEGAPWFTGSQAIELYDNHDGTFLAIAENYMDNNSFQAEDDFDSRFYAPKKNWTKSISNQVDLRGYNVARIAPHEYNGKKTYRLLEWYTVDSPERAKEKMREMNSPEALRTQETLWKQGKEAMDYLLKNDYASLSGMVHPEKGLRFVPYAEEFISGEKNGVVLSADELKTAYNQGKQYTWGTDDDSGKPIVGSLKDYASRYIINEYFDNAPFIRLLMHGDEDEDSSIIADNGNGIVVFKFTSSATGPYEWFIHALVFSQYDGKWYLNAIVHDENIQ